MSDAPNPGTIEAVALGCTCPVVDNHHGKGHRGIEGCFIYSFTCPLHNPELPRSDDASACPVCAKPLRAGETCALDIDLGTCHAECLEGSATVDLATGDPVDGPIPTFPYEGSHG